MQKSAVSTFSATDKDALLDQFKAIVDAGELTMRSDSSTSSPVENIGTKTNNHQLFLKNMNLHLDSYEIDRYIRAIESLNDRYGWHLDAQDVLLRLDSWKRLGPNQMGKPCGRGWVGLRGACKRGKKGDDNAGKIKESKVALADKIRKKKGMSDRNVPKQMPEPVEIKATSARKPKAKAEAKKQRTKATTPDRSQEDFLDRSQEDLVDFQPLGRIQRTPLKFMKPGSGPNSKDKASPELVEALKGKKNVQPIMVRAKGSDSYEIVSGHKVADAMKKNGSDFAQVVIMDRKMEEQLKLERRSESPVPESMSRPIRKRGGASESELSQPLGRILRTPLKFMKPGSGPNSKDKADPELIEALRGKKNVQPIMVRSLGNDSYEILSGHRTADAMKKSGSDFAQVVIMDRKMEAQWRLESQP